MIDLDVRDLVHREHHEDLLPEAERVRLVREAPAESEKKSGVVLGAMNWPGRRLQLRPASGGSVLRLAGVNRPH